MINLCARAGLPAPDFRQEGGQFVQTLWRDWLTDAVMEELGLNDRQRKAVAFVKTNVRITNSGFQELLGVAKRTAQRDLSALVSKGIFEQIGITRRGTHYELAKGAIKGP